MSTIDRKAHPHCAALRELTADEWIDMLDSFEAHGPRDAVIVADLRTGLIVDGWHTYHALKHLGIDPEPYVRLREFKDDTEIGEYVMARQLGRRNATAAENIAMANAILAATVAASTENIAEKAGEPVRQVRRWRRIERTGAVPLREAVRQGRVSLVDGEALAMLPESAQLDALRGGEHAVRAAVEQVRAAQAKAGPPPSAGKADPVAAADDALRALNGVDLAKLMRRYNKPSLAATWEQAPRAEKDALLARVKLASGPAPALPSVAKLNGGGAARKPSSDELDDLWAAVNELPPERREEVTEFICRGIMNMPVEEGGFGGDRMMWEDFVWFEVLDDDGREKALDVHPELPAKWMRRACDEKVFGTLDTRQFLIDIERLRNSMPHNAQVTELCDMALDAVSFTERDWSKKRLDGFLKTQRRVQEARQ
jgi:hypothetical protein